MVDSDIDGSNAFNEKIIAEFRANEGHVGGPLAGTPILLLHHIGAKSGVERVTPLAYHPQADGGFVIVASNGGSPRHPSWYYNLKTIPGSKSRPIPRSSRHSRKSWTARSAPTCGRS
jgi:deazaflavin-dependent oxidoreductase (nitroreductase family)